MRRYTVIVRDTRNGQERECVVRACNLDQAILKATRGRKSFVVVWADVD